MPIELVTPATETLFCTVAQVKRELDIDHSSHDALLGEICEEVRDLIVDYTGRPWARARVIETFPGFSNPATLLSMTPVITVHSVSLSGTALASTGWRLADPENGVLQNLTLFQDSGIYYGDGGTPVPSGDALNDYSCEYTGGYLMADHDTPNLPMGLRRIARDACRTILLGRYSPQNLVSKRAQDVSAEFSEVDFLDGLRARLEPWKRCI